MGSGDDTLCEIILNALANFAIEVLGGLSVIFILALIRKIKRKKR